MKTKIFFLLLIVGLVSGCAGESKTLDYLDKYEHFSVHTELQDAYLNDTYENYSKYANGREELSMANVMNVSLSGGEHTLTLSELDRNEKVIASKTYVTSESSFSLDNFKINTLYRLSDKVNDTLVSEKTFQTKGIIRNLNVDGITNCRDLGGYVTNSGKIVKQDMLFRTSKYNKDQSSESIISEKGSKILTEELGIKTEIDLRLVEESGITASLLPGVTLKSFPMKSSGNILRLNTAVIKEVISFLADPSIYPASFHCSIGTDRTGCIAFLVNGLLGVKEDELFRDYLFSNFGDIGSPRTPSAIKTYIQTIGGNKEDDLSTRIYNYLLNILYKFSLVDNSDSLTFRSNNRLRLNYINLSIYTKHTLKTCYDSLLLACNCGWITIHISWTLNINLKSITMINSINNKLIVVSWHTHLGKNFLNL